jgi:hypothetical protein
MTRRAAALPGMQYSRDGGVVPKQKVPGETRSPSRSPCRFPGEFYNERSKHSLRSVVKTTVTSPEEREMQVRILPREQCARVAENGKAPNVPWSNVPRPININ